MDMKEKYRLGSHGQMSLSVKEDIGDLLNTWTRKLLRARTPNRVTSEAPDPKPTNEVSNPQHQPPFCVDTPVNINISGGKKYWDVSVVSCIIF